MRKIETLGDLTLKDFLFMESIFDEEGKLKYTDKEVNKLFIKHFDLGGLDINETDKVFKNLIEIKEEIISKEDFKLTLRFDYKGVEYGFIPNIRDKFLTMEWCDADINLEDPIRLMSILYRPVIKKKWWQRGKEYEIEKYSGSHDRFSDLPLDIYLGANFFFIVLEKTLLEILNIYTLRQQVGIMMQVLDQSKVSQSNTTGTI